MLTKGVILLHNNAQPHTTTCTNAFKCFNQALQLGDFRPPSLQSRPGAKRLPSLHHDGLVGYPALPHQQTAHGWSQQLAA